HAPVGGHRTFVDVDDRGVVTAAVADVVERDRHVGGNLALHAAAERPRVRHAAIAVDQRSGRGVVDDAPGQDLIAQAVQEGAACRAFLNGLRNQVLAGGVVN